MARNRLLIHSIFLLVLPVIVAYYGISTPGAIALVLLVLAWRLMITVSIFVFPPRVPKLELETISLSHFAEKARWCMDRLGIEYVERQTAGILGVFFIGRTVPRLKIRTGLVRSEIGNSPDILRYLWGCYAAELGTKADFLAPSEERLELEKRIDRYGYDLQVWVYSHILDDRDVCLRAWGWGCPTIPLWQRGLLYISYPALKVFMRRAFKLNEEGYAGAVARIEGFLFEMEEQLKDGRDTILNGDEIDYVDITLASISSLWLQPDEFAAGKSDKARLKYGEYPAKLRADVERWRHNYPKTTAFAENLYKEERN